MMQMGTLLLLGDGDDDMSHVGSAHTPSNSDRDQKKTSRS